MKKIKIKARIIISFVSIAIWGLLMAMVCGGAIMAVSDGAGDDNALNGGILGLLTQTAGSADADKGIRAAVNQLFQRDGCGRAAHAGAHAGDRNTFIDTGPGAVFTVIHHFVGFVPERGNDRDPAGIARKQYIRRDIAVIQLNMILQSHSILLLLKQHSSSLL